MLRWGLLLPICYRGEAEQDACWQRLRNFTASLKFSTNEAERNLMTVFVGIDQHDMLFDKDEARHLIAEMITGIGVSVSIHMLRSSFRHKLCHIWNHLAQQAVLKDSDLFVLVGDDVAFLTAGWKGEIEQHFSEIADARKLPFGFACVCFRDVSFRIFPTFPVIHRSHMEAMGSLFPPVFVNQHGDPFLFELYRRWGASLFAATSCLDNTVGGSGAARYQKHATHWRDEVLTDAISSHESFLSSQGLDAGAARIPCLNKVVPSYRCHVETLRKITSLRVSPSCQCSVHILVVVDNPGSPALGGVQALQDWTPNHLVRVYVQPENMGASQSRNAGMAQSFGDWTVLLDDDVVPQENLLDAYLGATMRFPTAKILVGLTQLPEPATLMQRALVASEMAFFYGISQRMKHPPWGVTANMCVEGRRNNTVWFSDVYPRTGGGEDVDFCLRVKALQPAYQRDSVIVSVPEAAVLHPFWPDILKQVVGWARGDCLCLDALPHSTFYALPNWMEWILLLLLAHLCFGVPQSPWTLLLCASGVAASEAAMGLLVVFPNTQQQPSLIDRLLITLLAILPALAQDLARLYTKLSRGFLFQLFSHFDWMDGQREHVTAIRSGLLVRGCMWAIIVHGCCTCSMLRDWLSASLHVAAVLVILLVWAKLQRFDLPTYQRDYVRTFMTPLPIEAGDAAGTPGCPVPFVVLAYQRTGSNLLCGKLHNHPLVLMHNEVFNEVQVFSYREMEMDPAWDWDVFQRNNDPTGFLLSLFKYRPPRARGGSQQSRAKAVEPAAIGFKLFPEHWTAAATPALQRLVADPRTRKVVLRRDNYLDVYASKLRADKSGHYLSKTLDGISISIDPAAFQSFVEHYDECYAYYETLMTGQGAESVHRLSYEELVADPEGATRGLLEFLGVDASFELRPLSVTVKQTKEPLDGHISNYEEIKFAFSCTKVADSFIQS